MLVTLLVTLGAGEPIALTLRLTRGSYGRQTVVLREFSTHPRSGERSYI